MCNAFVSNNIYRKNIIIFYLASFFNFPRFSLIFTAVIKAFNKRNINTSISIDNIIL